MLGKTNAASGDGKLETWDIIAVFRCTYSGNSRGNVSNFFQKDYVSYDSSNYTFKVLKPFTAALDIFAKGSRNPSGTDYSITVNFNKNGSSVINGSSNNQGNGTITQSTYSISFAVGDTFSISGSHGVTTYRGEVGFILCLYQ